MHRRNAGGQTRFLFAFDTSFAAGERLCGTLSYNDNITHSPAYGGRMKRNGKSGQLQRLDPQKQIGRTSSGENSLFSPLASSLSKKPTPITLFRETPHSAVCVFQRSRTKERGLWFTPNYSDQTQILFSKSMSRGSIQKKNLVGLEGKVRFPLCSA